MRRRTVAVYDCSEGYIKQLMEYFGRKKDLWFDAKGFSETSALENYLNQHDVDLLLFSMEDLPEKKEDNEIDYVRFISHENVKHFVYFGERRNSKSKLKHISKYQSVEGIIAEIKGILFSYEEQQELAGDREHNKPSELVCIYTPAPDPTVETIAIQLSEILTEEMKTLLIDLERFSILPYLTRLKDEDTLTDLIFYYKTNRQKLKSNLERKRKRYHNIDILSASVNAEDFDEIPENEWVDFIMELAVCGGYDTVVVFMGEVFRKPELLFVSADVIYVPLPPGEPAIYKAAKFMKYLLDSEHPDVMDKIRLMAPVEERQSSGSFEGDREWNFLEN